MNPVLGLEEAAHEHLLMHFTRNGAFGPGRQPVLVLERGEGPYVFDTQGNRYFDGGQDAGGRRIRSVTPRLMSPSPIYGLPAAFATAVTASISNATVAAVSAVT